MNDDALTTNAFFNGRIKILQYQKGYRFSIDAVLLAGYARIEHIRTVIDLGTGCGIIPIMLAYRYPGVKIYAVEIQPRLAELAVQNVKQNQMQDRIAIQCADMKTLTPAMFPETIDGVISNPPYRKIGSGRINPHDERAVARHEIAAALSDVVNTASRLLSISGRFVVICPAERLTDLMLFMRTAGIEPKILRTVHSGPRTEAKRILVEGIRGGRPGMKITSPIVIYQEDGIYTPEVQQLLTP